MTTTDPEHGTREWSEDPVGDLLKMYQTIKDAFEKITEDIKRFSEGLADLTHTLLPLEKPGWAVHNKRRYRTRRVQPKIRLNAVPLGTGTYLYTMAQQSELDYLIYNDSLGYANLILNGDSKEYLKNVTGSHGLEI